MHEQFVDHHCPVEGFIAVEAGCPCNWCSWTAPVPQKPPSGRLPDTTHKQGASMNKTTKVLAILAAAFAFAAHATPGNNGGGNGGCGNGQTTNGCPGTVTPPPVLIPGPMGPQGPQGIPGESIKGDPGAPGKDGESIAGRDGTDGKDGVSIAGKDGSDATVPVDVVREAALNDATQKLNGRLDAMQGQIDRNDRRAAAGVSAAIAFASMPQTIEPGSVSLAVGVGSYDSEAGAAFGVSGRDVSGSFTWKAGVTIGSRGTAGVGAGAAWRFK
jgi:hypothetical protein